MKVQSHPEVEGSHAFLSASSYSWIRYDADQIRKRVRTQMQHVLGTRLHALAAELISMNQKLADTNQTLNMYVNDAIGFRMRPEVVLFATRNAFGTADAIGFRKEPNFDKMVLRIHDLKTGVSKVSVNQLEIYAAFFCIEYDIHPRDITILLRIYQNDDFIEYEAEPTDIMYIIDQIQTFDRVIEETRVEAFA